MINKPLTIAKQMKSIEKLAKLVVSLQLDSIEVNGVKITKTRHVQTAKETKSQEGMMKIPDGVSEAEVNDLVTRFWSAL